jgi:CHAT domain-containing protein
VDEFRQFGDDPRRLAAKNPLGFTGLVLANGEVLTGLSLIDLALENLRLITLSACETGLGDYTGGEGVQGLQSAFHLAGCPNVVASLWKVNDEATAALMRRFYHHLWEKNEPPIQALRRAQLELYRNPTQIADLMRGGAPKFSGVAKPLPKGEEPKAGERAATKLWAVFVLSGVGR